jgi:tetratricopeptide (TPR) repeat protein
VAEYKYKKDVSQTSGYDSIYQGLENAERKSAAMAKAMKREREAAAAEEARQRFIRNREIAHEKVGHDLPLGWDLFQKGNYTEALSLLETCYVLRTETAGHFGSYDIILPEGITVQSLREAVFQCYLKTGEMLESNGDYIKALRNITIANAYCPEKEDGTRDFVFSDRIDALMDKLCPQAESGDMEALKALMDAYYFQLITDTPRMNRYDGEFTKPNIIETPAKNRITDKDFPKPVNICIKLAEEHNPTAAFLLAEHYRRKSSIWSERDREGPGGSLGIPAFVTAGLKRRKQLYQQAIKDGYKPAKEAKKALEEVLNELHPNRSNALFFLPFVFGIISAALMGVGLYVLQRYGFAVSMSIFQIIITTICVTIVSIFLFRFLPVRIVCMILAPLLLLGSIASLFITGNGLFTSDFKMNPVTLTGMQTEILIEPQADAELRHSLPISSSPVEANAMGEYNDWLLVGFDELLGLPGIPQGWIQSDGYTTKKEGETLRQFQAATVISNNLNIRDFPRIESKRTLNAAQKGDTVYTWGTEDDGWIPVVVVKKIIGFVTSYSTIYGYALANNVYVEGSEKSSSNSLTIPEGEPMTVNADRDMRSSRRNPSRHVSKNVKEGETVIVLDPNPTEAGWVHIWFDGEVGWIGKSALGVE